MAISLQGALTDQEKLGIVASHIKNKEFALYNEELDRLEEASSPTPNQVVIADIDTRLAVHTAKLIALRVVTKKLEDAIVFATTSPPPTV